MDQKESPKNKKIKGIMQASRKNRKAAWAAVYINKRLIRWRSSVITNLEWIDRRLNNQQRKWLFYLGVLSCSSFLTYLVGSALKKPPAFFVAPLGMHTKQLFKASVLKRLQDSTKIIIHF